ncbi:alpha/beta fold hydrolase [Actinomadura sp. 9N215]|uniref:alpha/beta fold hydrolase n=1 Tax=Actinomadura sp. 9N215 TaxID=3375150 RepID=UPI0037A820E6
MATYTLIPGAGGQAWYWHRLVPELRARGHDVVAVDLPTGDDSAGLREYADAVVEAIGGRADVILVAQSMGGFTAPIVCERVPVDLLVMLNAMVPVPGETGGAWWDNTGQAQAMADFAALEGRTLSAELDVKESFLHDVPPEVTAEAFAQGEPPQSSKPFMEPWPLQRWPSTPTVFLQGRDDRFFPLEFQRRVVGERLGIPVDEMPGGHAVALSRPRELAERLEEYRTRLASS